jgi:Mn-dependent DtxR family transcriptional regulator
MGKEKITEEQSAEIKYQAATAMIKKMLKAGLITQEEYERIDLKNKEFIR